MRHNGTSELFAYWNRLRGTRAAPERREIAPASIGKYLSDTFILQAIGACEPRFRLAGTRICSIYGRELKNLTFASLWQIKDRSSIARLLRNSMTGKSVMHLSYEGKSTRGRKALFELSLLPLASEANERHLMGMIVALGRPFWLESDAIIENAIQSIAIIDPNQPLHPSPGGPLAVAGHATPMTPFTQTIVSRKVRHLRVLDGGKIID
jgi:hypothetical protein